MFKIEACFFLLTDDFDGAYCERRNVIGRLIQLMKKNRKMAGCYSLKKKKKQNLRYIKYENTYNHQNSFQCLNTKFRRTKTNKKSYAILAESFHGHHNQFEMYLSKMSEFKTKLFAEKCVLWFCFVLLISWRPLLTFITSIRLKFVWFFFSCWKSFLWRIF